MLVMQWLVIISILLIDYNVAKETVTYQVSDVDLIYLIRGYKTKEDGLKLTKVDGDVASLPDGIYFKPEDEALTGDSKYLNFNGQYKKTSSDKKLAITESN
ncbi:uncharacterized protein LOC124631920 [Helicoverpa zea]|uniref:uncharacterized protein LOC124631920 n=1 Tax=Helicoverpa zea TaxID=7113 RepID=UPI001F565878|nr:uncharacterized protein LOC124631920 [Helicoverpa zea]